MHNATEAGSAFNAIQMRRRAHIPANIRPVAHFIVFDGDRFRLDPKIDGLWTEARPLVARMIEHVPQTIQAIRAAIDALKVLPVAVVNAEGTITALALMSLDDLADGSQAVLIAIEAASNWPELQQIIDYAVSVAGLYGARSVIMWSPSPLPPLDGWCEIAAPGLENERAMLLTLLGGE
jgi:hypothetical protein